MKFNTKGLKRSAVALGFGVFVLLGTGATANAQSHQSHERRDTAQHQRQERAYYGNSHAVNDHQYQERYQAQRHQQIERYNNGYGQYGYGSNRYGSSGYYNDDYGNSRSYNNGYYANNGGYYSNNYGGSYGHIDSRNGVKRFFHHAFGGH